MAWCGTMISNDFEGQIADLENEISKRQLSVPEAKIFHDHLESIHRKVSVFETDIKTLQYAKHHQISTCLNTIRVIHLRTINLKMKLTEIIASNEATVAKQTKPVKKSSKFMVKLNDCLASSSTESEESDSNSETSESEQTKPSELKQTLQSIERKLSNLESLYENLLESRLDEDETCSNASSSTTDSYDDNYKLYEDILKKISSIESMQSYSALFQGTIMILYIIFFLAILLAL